mgnify:CR=1 FL=1
MPPAPDSRGFAACVGICRFFLGAPIQQPFGWACRIFAPLIRCEIDALKFANQLLFCDAFAREAGTVRANGAFVRFERWRSGPSDAASRYPFVYSLVMFQFGLSGNVQPLWPRAVFRHLQIYIGKLAQRALIIRAPIGV